MTRPLRGQQHPPPVVQPGAGALPRRDPVADHRHACPGEGRGGGSNGSRVRLWKRELQKLANELGLDIVVSHLPPGTSKWNKIEHRLFSFISQNWRAQPLISYRVIVELISATTTKTGLTVRCELDTAYTPAALSCPTPRSPPSTSNGPSSTASGTTPSHRIPIRQIARLFPDAPLAAREASASRLTETVIRC